MKEERQDLNEVEEKYQDQKDHVTGEKTSELQHSNNRSQKSLSAALSAETLTNIKEALQNT